MVSTIDLASGWKRILKIRIKLPLSLRLAFIVFHVMPFGLCNAPITLQRLIETVLKGLQWSTCLVYLDDIIVFSSSVEEHLIRLKLYYRDCVMQG